LIWFFKEPIQSWIKWKVALLNNRFKKSLMLHCGACDNRRFYLQSFRRKIVFSKFAKWISEKLGDARAFLCALLLVIIWALLGRYFNFSEAWQLAINTTTTVIIFLMVFLIQNTQNRNTMAVHLKLDEIIRAIEGANDELLKIEKLSDEELQILHRRYETLAANIKARIKNGKSDDA
jgi:low affinity Fe/Cu permease